MNRLERKLQERFEGKLRRGVCSFDLGSSAPAPDPAIGQSAQEEASVARDQLAFNKQQYAELAPTIKQILDQQVKIGNMSADNAQSQWEHYQKTYLPVENQMAADAMAEGSPQQQAAEAAQAGATVRSQFDAGRAAQGRDFARMGVNPNSGRFVAADQASRSAEAAAEAGAMNTARTNARLRGIAMRSGVAQFGRNMPQTGIASDALALNAGSSAVNTGTSGINAANAGVNSALPWYSTSTNTMLGQYGAQMQGYQADQEAMAGLFQGLGMAGGMAMKSSKEWKEKRGDVTPSKVVAAIKTLPVDKWAYKRTASEDGAEHIGPYAEDFKKRFGVGDGKHISVIDAIGVTLAAVKGVAQKVDRLEHRAARAAGKGVARA